MTTLPITIALEFYRSSTLFAIVGLPTDAAHIINRFVGDPITRQDVERRGEIVFCTLMLRFPVSGHRRFSFGQYRTIEISLN